MSGPGYVFKNSGTTPPPIEKDDRYKFPNSQNQYDQKIDREKLYNPGVVRFDEDQNQVVSNGQVSNGQVSNGQAAPNSISNTINQHLPESVQHLNPAPIIQEHTEVLKAQFSPDSHELAHATPEHEGAVQVHFAGENGNVVRDIGWHKHNDEIPDPLIGGISNNNLFSMIRRFNKDVFAVRRTPLQLARGLDLNDAWSDEYGTDKLTLHLQRVYLSIVLGLASFGKQVARLRSWKETRRTTAFCVAYFTAWLFDLLMPLVLGTMIIIIASPQVRDVLFPPAPRALVNTSTGGLQKPQAGQLGTADSLTGAPEKQPGEAVEEEAANFVDNIRHLVQKAVGMHENEKSEGDPLEGKIPKPVRKAVKEIKGAGTTSGHTEGDSGQTEKPMEEVLWAKAHPKKIEKVIKTAPHALGEIVDNWERFANAISPTPPFSRFSFLRIEALLLPLFLGSFFINSYMVYKGTGFAIGFGIFGDPVLTPALEWINHNYPQWMELLEPKNNILRGVPTNAQLALTLLRIGEAHNTPLPPVPTSKDADANQIDQTQLEDIPLDATDAEKLDAIEPSTLEKPHSNEDGTPDQPKHKKLSKITRIFKGNTKAVVETKLAADHVRAAAGSDKAKGHLGVLPKEKNLAYAGPSDFKARYDGKRGWIYITETAQPSVCFTTHSPRPDGSHTDEAPLVTIPVEQIKELKRATAFVSKPGEIAADWSSGKQLLGSVEIVDLKGQNYRFTALPERDELFNRLVAIGDQRWENL